MSDDSEEACLVNPRSPSLSGYPAGLMPYTDGIQSVSHYGAQMNSSNTSAVSGSSPSAGRGGSIAGGSSTTGSGRGTINTNNNNNNNNSNNNNSNNNNNNNSNNQSDRTSTGGGVSDHNYTTDHLYLINYYINTYNNNYNNNNSNINNNGNTYARLHQAGSSGRGSQSHESESGELIDYNDDILLSQFHADAIKQAGCGKFQLLATLIIGLGLAGHAIQVYAVFYIIPSAELEYCILDSEKNWLGSITLLGLGCGALLWGGLAGRTGRRKTLLSCLAVSGVFSVVAAFMPTYGPFMMARFCSAAGVGGALPAGASYLCEICPTHARSRILALLGALGVSGAIFAGGIAVLTVPQTGQMVTLENKEHFSAWHRYLLLVTLPSVFSILGLFWLPESPRWLLESGREVEALAIYQKIFRNNRTRGGYTLTELELPGARAQRHQVPTSVLAGMAHGIQMFFSSFLQLFRKSHLKTTLLLLGAWTAAIFVYHGLTIFIAEHSRSLEQENYSRQTLNKVNKTYENAHFNTSMDNLIFTQCKFINCTFRRVFISHVHFDNCSFIETEFANVKTSRTSFKNCIFDNVKLIDSDLTERHFVNCTRNNTEIIRLTASCDRDFEYNIFLEALWRSNLGALIPGLITMSFIGEAIHRFGRSRIATLCFTFSTMLCCAFGFLFIDEHVIWTGGTAQGLILGGLAALTVLTIETYTTSLRCTALGLFICGGHMGALISAPIYTALPSASSKFAAAASTITMAIPVLSSAALKDPCLLL